MGPLYPERGGSPDVEYAIFTTHGLKDLAESTWLEAAAVNQRARASVKKHLTERFGARSPRGGAISFATLLLVFTPAIPLGILNAVRLGSTNLEPAAAITVGTIGLVALIIALCAGGRPVARSTLFQTEVLAVLLIGTAIIGAMLTTGFSRASFLIGAAASALAAILHLIGRGRHATETAQIDNGLEDAYLVVSAEVQDERDRMIRELTTALTSRTDIEDMRALRSATITALREAGNAATDPDPQSIPGAYIVRQNTTFWLPPTHRNDATAD